MEKGNRRQTTEVVTDETKEADEHSSVGDEATPNVSVEEDSGSVHQPIQALEVVKDSEDENNSDELDKTREFVCARGLLPETLNKKEVFLSPAFRSAAALAGWDDESLLIATEEQTDFNLEREEGNRAISVERSPEARSERRQIRDKKREVRTPKQAITPLSAGRRHRKPRRQSINQQCSQEELRIKDLSLTQEFQEETKNLEVGEQAQTEAAEIELQKTTSKLSSQSDAASENEKEIEKPVYLDELREELSCAICLDICFEPSTTCCGHSFCRSCLRSVLQKCGQRCPKCRQMLKGDGWRTCPVNIILWNTIQILFPKESALKAVSKEQQADQIAPSVSDKKAARSNPTITVHPSWRGSSSSARYVASTLRSLGSSRSAFRPPARVQQRVVLSSDDEDAESMRSYIRQGETREEGRRSMRVRQLSRQEELDAALASRLQQAELIQSIGIKSSLEQEEAELYASLRSLAPKILRHGYGRRA